MPVSNAMRDALRWGKEEVEELGQEFFEAKVFVYVETLDELAHEHGGALPADFELSDPILTALRDEARDHAEGVVATFNKDLEGFLDRNGHLTRESLLLTYDAWAVDRGEARAEIIAVTEAYSAAADATLAFHRANSDDEPEYDFGGHPGDDDPACIVCVELVESSPHPHERVLEIGNPHIGCRQSWHRRGAVSRETLEMPSEPAGIVGGSALVNRAGDHESAVAQIQALTA